MQRDRLPYLILPTVALVAVLPLILHGCSCGHDFDFHILSWMEAAHQFTHGSLHPHWAWTPAYNAGEPRFIFYPPLSWTIGAILGLIFPFAWTPILYTWLALTSAGFALRHHAKTITTPASATLAAVFYMVNPYMLFTAYERTAYAELLAAAWIPLLLHAILRDKVTIPRIAIPIALLWLTNAPAAVMACYTLALLTVIRLVQTRSSRLAINTITGTMLGLGLASFYLVPAAYERRFVQVAMAIIPNMRIEDNFLFHHTGDIPHDQVLHTASFIALILIALTAAALIIARTSTKHRVPHRSPSEGRDVRTSTSLLTPLAILITAITLLLTPLTAFLWNHLPEMAFLQFPWRLLAILAAVLSLTLALALSSLRFSPARTALLAILTAVALIWPAYSIFHQPCDEEDTVEARQTLFHSTQGTDPTDEYTPITADNDSLAHNNPPYWLSSDPNAKAPANVPSGPIPNHFSVKADKPGFLVLNLRDYPSWNVSSTDPNSMELNHPKHIQRDDGLIALPIYYAADYKIEITWIQPPDQTIGYILTAISLILLTLLSIRRSASSY